MEKEQKRALLESVLFISGTPLNLKDLQRITEFSTGEISFLINELIAEYRNRRGGILLVEVAEGFQMVSNPEYSHWIKKLKATTPQKLSIAALETLFPLWLTDSPSQRQSLNNSGGSTLTVL